MTTSVNKAIDDAAAKAKELAEKAGHAVKDGAGKVADVAQNAAEKVKHAGDRADQKLGG